MANDASVKQVNNDKDILEVTSLSISFGGLTAVDNFSMSIKQGELYGLIGPNGAGKTTVFNLLTGVYTPDQGAIVLDGENIVGKSVDQISKIGMARTFQNIRLFHRLTVLDNVKAGMNNFNKYSLLDAVFALPNKKKMEEKSDIDAMDLLGVFGLDKYADLLAGNLSYGEQRKLEIARALATKPKLLLLDEPAAGMNNHETADLMDTIRFVRDKFKITVLLIEHDMKLVSGICERLTVLNFGKVLKQGITNDVLNDEEVIKAYLGD